MALIGITACRKLEDYKQSILHVSGEVRIVDASMSVDDALNGIDGLMLTGGDDVAPSRANLEESGIGDEHRYEHVRRERIGTKRCHDHPDACRICRTSPWTEMKM